MGYKTDNIVRDLSRIIVDSNRRKTSAYDTSATVTRVENDIMYVQMPGSTEETPVKRTVNAKVGDVVQVRVSGHTGFVVGNATNPPTDDTTAVAANRVATTALAKSVEAIDANTITARQLQADEARITNLQATALTAESAIITNLQTNKADVSDLNAATARIGDLETNALTADSAVIKSLQTDKANVSDLNAAKARIGDLETDHVSTQDLEAAQADIDALEAKTAVIDSLDTTYAQIDLANVNNAWIQNGVIKNGAIADAQIIGVSANKLTAGTIDASNITVTNLNADNITTGTINGQRIGAGSLSLDKLSEDVYTESEVDAKLKTMQDEIDGAIETWTGTVVPTLNNTPASNWKTSSDRDKHVGDVYYVVNAGNQADGYCYRFAKSGSTYSWVLIKDSDVTAALQRLVDAEGDISDLQTFESNTSSWISNTDEELRSLKTRTTSVETSLGDKVDTSTFNELSQTVDENSSSITSLNTAVSKKADSSTVTTLSNTVNTVSQKADSNETKITNLTKTVSDNETDIEQKYSSLSQDLSGFKTTVGNTYTKQTDFTSYQTSNDAAVAAAKKAGDDAQNDLDDYKETNDVAVAGAVSDASTAKTNAASAVSTANTAASDASTAKTNAATALSTSNTAASDASTAKTDAATAKTDAATALSTANDAMDAADAIQDDLDAYKTTVSSTYATKTSLTQTESSIRSDVSSTYATKTTVSGIDGRLQSAESTISDHSTSITQNTNAIALKANATDVYTKAQTDDLIATEISDAKAEIKITTDSISSEVSKKVGANELISRINQSPESILISASKITVGNQTLSSEIDSIRSDIENATPYRYNHTYTESNGVYTFTATLSYGETDITSTVDPNRFMWFLRTETGDELYARGVTMTINETQAGFRGSVIGGFEDGDLEVLVVGSDGSFIIGSDGAAITAVLPMG